MNQRKQYDAYLESWKEKYGQFVKPKIYSMWSDEGEALGAEVNSAFESSGKNSAFYPLGKYLRGDLNSNVITCPSGRVIEVGADFRGNWIYAEWGSMEEAMTYDAPMPFFAWAEQW